MIFGNIESTDLSTIGHEGVRRAMEWAREHDIRAAVRSQRYRRRCAVAVNVAEYDSKAFEDCKFEAHKRYIDVQVVASGIERIDSPGDCHAKPANSTKRATSCCSRARPLPR